MRKFSTLALCMGYLPTAAAHSLDGDATLAQEITHLLTGAHHLPLLLVAVVVFAAIVRSRRENRRR